MAKSLNQAFIKAYSKEKSAEASRKATAAANSEANANLLQQDFIVRFDTATVEVPAPHIMQSWIGKQPTVMAASTASSISQLRSVSEHRRPSEEKTRVNETQHALESDELRDSIAAQMMKAGGWQDHPTDTLVGSFPMQSQSYAPTVLPAKKADVPESQLPPKGQKVITAADENQVPSESDPPELAAPEAPALSSSNVESALSERRATRRPGEIFRLDRPSYSSGASKKQPLLEPSPSEPEQDSGDQSSVIGTFTSKGLDIRLDSKRPSPQFQLAKEVEVNLRQARQRIFNPVWEVDCFQWPAICKELLTLRKESMERVAKNLVASCAEGLQILAVTSTHGGEGRTTVACCLAMLAGSYGLNVAIVDGDIENPTISLQTNLDVELDWKTALLEEIPIEEVAIHSINDQVTLLPLIGPLDQAEIASDDKRIAMMLQELSESFDLVIVDTGHMDSTRNLVMTMGEQGLISAVVTVVDHRTSSAPLVEACIRRIRRAGIASVGLVENFAA